jgi:hypothetical protein
MAINLVTLATEIEKLLGDISTILKALPTPVDPTVKAALDRVKSTLPPPPTQTS